MSANPTLSAIVDASTAYMENQRALDSLKSQKAILLSQVDEINAKIDQMLPVVAASKQALKDAAGTL